MRMNRLPLMLGLLAAAGLACISNAHAANPERERAALRRLQQAQQQLVQEKAQLETQKNSLQQENQTMSTEMAKLKDDVRDKERVQAANGALTSQLAKSRELGASLRGDLEHTRTALAEMEQKAKALEAESAARKTRIEACEGLNDKLYGVGQELLGKYQHKGVWSSLAQSEPIFRLKRVELENLMQDYQDKLEAGRVRVATGTEAEGHR